MAGPTPPNPYQVGDVLSARELNEQQENAWRGSQTVGAGTTGVVRPPGSEPIISGDPIPRVFARITGRGSGCAESGSGGDPYPPPIATTAANCYCGIETISNQDGSIEDFPGGLVWDSFSFPLVEMTGRDDVPVDAIVWVSPSRTGMHWEFLWMDNETTSGSGGSGCGSGCVPGISLNCLVRCVGSPPQLQVATGCLYVTINGVKHYLQYESA